MRERNNKLLGIVLVIAGVLFLLDALNVISGIFFKGWWTLFLIIPGLYSMTRQGITAGNTILVVIGGVLLLDKQGVDLWGYLLPAILIVLGLGIALRK